MLDEKDLILALLREIATLRAELERVQSDSQTFQYSQSRT